MNHVSDICLIPIIVRAKVHNLHIILDTYDNIYLIHVKYVNYVFHTYP